MADAYQASFLNKLLPMPYMLQLENEFLREKANRITTAHSEKATKVFMRHAAKTE